MPCWRKIKVEKECWESEGVEESDSVTDSLLLSSPIGTDRLTNSTYFTRHHFTPASVIFSSPHLRHLISASVSTKAIIIVMMGQKDLLTTSSTSALCTFESSILFISMIYEQVMKVVQPKICADGVRRGLKNKTRLNAINWLFL